MQEACVAAFIAGEVYLWGHLFELCCCMVTKGRKGMVDLSPGGW